MKIHYKHGFYALIITGLLFTSCSREVTSLNRSNKLENMEALQKSPVQVNHDQRIATIPVKPGMVFESTKAYALSANAETVSKVSPRQFAFKKHSPVANVLRHAIQRQVTKEAMAMKTAVKNKTMTSYSATSHTTGWLGFAIGCLILGIIFFALGFGLLGSIFWEIGIVVLVVGIVFFILWLLAQAV